MEVNERLNRGVEQRWHYDRIKRRNGRISVSTRSSDVEEQHLTEVNPISAPRSNSGGEGAANQRKGVSCFPPADVSYIHLYVHTRNNSPRHFFGTERREIAERSGVYASLRY